MADDHFTIALTGQALAALQRIAEQRGVTVADALARAIAHERWLTDEVAAGSRICAENALDGERRVLDVSGLVAR